jgi:type IV secretory pathway VirB2 component (pilin)
MEIHLKIIGVVLIVLALVHAIFPRYFDWQKQLNGLSLVNRQMMYVHTFFVALMVFLMGVLCLNSADELINTHLGRQVCLGLGVFWSIRLVIQFFGYSAELWKGKTFETIVHILFGSLWTYLSVIFIAISCF